MVVGTEPGLKALGSDLLRFGAGNEAALLPLAAYCTPSQAASPKVSWLKCQLRR